MKKFKTFLSIGILFVLLMVIGCLSAAHIQSEQPYYFNARLGHSVQLPNGYIVKYLGLKNDQIEYPRKISATKYAAYRHEVCYSVEVTNLLSGKKIIHSSPTRIHAPIFIGRKRITPLRISKDSIDFVYQKPSPGTPPGAPKAISIQ